jgi:hypothetical protein
VGQVSGVSRAVYSGLSGSAIYAGQPILVTSMASATTFRLSINLLFARR